MSNITIGLLPSAQALVGTELFPLDQVNGSSPTGYSTRTLTLSALSAYANGNVTPIKAPCRIATVGSNITLSGLQTIDGVTLIAGDRVLVKDQTTSSQNGIYVAAAGGWARSADAIASGQLVNGTNVFVNAGTLNAQTIWALQGTDPITIGTTAITFKIFPGQLGNVINAHPVSGLGPPIDPFISVQTYANSGHLIPFLDNNNFFTGNGVWPFGVIGQGGYCIGCSPSTVNSVVNGATYSLRFTSAFLTGSPITITYTATGADTLLSIANGLVTLLNANATLSGGTNSTPIMMESTFNGAFNLEWVDVTLPDLTVASVGTGSMTIGSPVRTLDGVITIFGRRSPGRAGKNGDFLYGIQFMGQDANGGGQMKAIAGGVNVYWIDATAITSRLDYYAQVANVSTVQLSLSAGILIGGAAGSYLGTGSINMIGPLQINKNAAQGTLTPANTSSLLFLQEADGAAPTMSGAAFGSAGGTTFGGRAARGTAAVPSNSLTNDLLFRTTGIPFVNGAFAGTAPVRFDLVYLDSSPNTGAGFIVAATPVGSTTRAEVFRAVTGVQIGVTASDPGAGGLTFNGQLFGPNIATTGSAANAFIDTGTSPVGQLKRSTSSLIYKRDVEPLDPSYAMKVLNGAKPIWYRSAIPTDNQAWSFYGLGAEDVADLDPRLVHFGYQDDAWEDFVARPAFEDNEGKHPALIERRIKTGAVTKPDSVQYDRLIPHLLLGWQQHEARLKALETKK